MVNIFKKNKKINEDSIKVKNNQIRYKKPKILLIDLEKNISDDLKNSGFNVSDGTLGPCYNVKPKKEYLPIYFDPKLPNLCEQEIICINLKVNNVLDETKISDNPLEKEQFWGECSDGIIDSRPVIMKSCEKKFERILNYGGVFIVFASEKTYQKILFGSKEGYLLDGDKQDLDNWSFLPFFDEGYYTIGTKNDYGEEIFINPEFKWTSLKRLIESNIKHMDYEVTFKPGNGIKDKWSNLLLNKYGDAVGGIFYPKMGGIVIILPQSSKKKEIIHELITNIIPSAIPSLFPEFENKSWLHNKEYEFENVKKYKSDINSVQEEAENKINELNNKIKEENVKWEFLNNIITETGEKLVENMIKCLEYIGFEKIKDVDKEIEKSSSSSIIKEEDLQICDNSPILLLEVKGIGGNPTDEDILQVNKYTLRRIKEWNRTDVKGLSVINLQRGIPPLDRTNFTEKQIKDTKNHEITLINTWNLYTLIRGMVKYQWDGKVIRNLFYTDEGIIDTIPSHYKKIGKITAVIPDKNVIGVRIESNKLIKGDKIGYIKGHEFFENDITSMQIDGNDIEEGNIGDEIGITIDSAKNNLKNLDLYKITYD